MTHLTKVFKRILDAPPKGGGSRVRIFSAACLNTSCYYNVAPKATQEQKLAPSSDLSLSYVAYENPKFAGCQSPLVLQHGLFARKENFTQLGKQLHHLTKRSLIIPDVRNHGSSPTSTKMSLKQMSGDLARLIQQLGVEGGVCLLGHATGGRVAMMTALTRPELVDRLILVSTSPINTPSSLARWEGYRQACYVVKTLVMGLKNCTMNMEESTEPLDMKQIEEVMGVEFKLEVNEALKSVMPDDKERALFLSNLGKVNVEAMLDNPELGTFPSLEGNTFTGPTMFVSGSRGPAWEGDEEIRKIKQLFPNSHFAQLPGAGQWVHTEKKDDFLALAATFLQTKFETQ